MSALAVGTYVLNGLRIAIIVALCFVSIVVIVEALARFFRAFADFLNAALRGAIICLAALIAAVQHRLTRRS